MTGEPEPAVWFCVVTRDDTTKKIVHYRCMSSRKEAESYKFQMEIAAESMCANPSTVVVETLPAGATPK